MSSRIKTVFFVAAVLFLLWVLAVLPGCGVAVPYATVGLAYQLDGETDYWLDRRRSWQCDEQPKVIAEAGLEYDSGIKVAAYHQSWLRCGGPFNERPEVYQNDIRVTKTWGGK